MSVDDKILEELRCISELLEPKPSSPSPEGLQNEFEAFLSKYRVMGLAVAFIMGIYLGSLVQALVDGLIMPIIALVAPGVAWESIRAGPFRVGHFLGASITFLVISFVIFILVKITKRWGTE
jgi:large conductance mechanosensitive channel